MDCSPERTEREADASCVQPLFYRAPRQRERWVSGSRELAATARHATSHRYIRMLRCVSDRLRKATLRPPCFAAEPDYSWSSGIHR